MSDTTLTTSAHDSFLSEEHREIQQQEQEWFDLQPIEKKLISYSLGLGIGLLGVFILIFEVFN